MSDNENRWEALKQAIVDSYEQGVTLEKAENLAGEFLYAQMEIADELRNADLDARMKKTGTKAVKAAVYMAEATKGDKKPSDVMLQNMVDLDENVSVSQNQYDEAEVNKDHLQNYLNIFKEAHVHFRTIARGKFE